MSDIGQLSTGLIAAYDHHALLWLALLALVLLLLLLQLLLN